MTAEKLHARLRAIRARVAIQRYEARQTNHAAGVWFRIQRLLAFSSRAWVINDDDARSLMAAGRQPHPSGLELEPPRRFFVLREEEAVSLASAHEIAVQSSAEMLVAPALALVLFDGIDPRNA
jgi:hypothetical protein